MRNDSNLQFIREKITQLGDAIMYNNSQEVLKYRNNIIRAIDVDNEGQLWFTAKRPACHLEECEQTFPARLFFYRKGKFFFVEASGKATVVNYHYPEGGAGAMLLKMNLSAVEYTEPDMDKPKSMLERYFTSAYNWVLRTLAVPHREQSVLPKMQ